MRSILVLVASVLVSLAGAELVLRAIDPPAPDLSLGNDFINDEILRPDPETLLHLRSNVDVSMDRLWPGWPVRIRTNASGQRMERELPAAASTGYRIATLGDSSTMGWGVEVEDAYPEVLAALLARRRPDVEVLNFGTVGFSSHNGLAQLETEVLPLGPDLVTLAFGFNDWSEQAGSDAERHEWMRASAAARDAHPTLDRLARRLRFLALGRRLEALWLPTLPWLPTRKRVPLDAYRKNLEAMVRLCEEAGADAVIVDLNLPNHYGEAERRDVAKRHGSPLLEVRRRLEARLGPEPDLEARFDLAAAEAPGPRDVAEIVFRVHAPAASPDPLLVIARHDALYDPDHDSFPLYDDGSHGDQRAGDRVFSRAMPAPPGSVDYAFETRPGATRAEQRLHYATRFYHHLDAPPVPTPLRYAPIQRAGAEPLRAFLIPFDTVHPNPAGHRRIAQDLAEIVEGIDAYVRHAAGPEPDPQPEDWFQRRRRFFER